jgi:CRP/FNR family transcriptional regulator, cyclic AMP receptor protein
MPMDDMDFTKPQPVAAPAAAPSAPFKASGSQFYDSTIAAAIFKASGRAERFSAGDTLFVEDQKASGGGLFSLRAASRMYFIAEGEVALTIGGRPLDTAKAGEVIGEMAVISERPRSATATAKTVCAAHSMSAEELKASLSGNPGFALMLMSVMFDRLRFVTARIAARNIPVAALASEPAVFDPPLLEKLESELPRTAIARYRPDATIMREGQAGAYMYVVKSGSVAITVRGRTVAAVKPGGTFGEMALVDQSARSATATASSECELLSIDRAGLMEAVKAHPAFAMAMLRAYAERLRHMNTQIA